jgi:predicted metallopeptidase
MFDYTDAMESLIRHIVETCPRLAHVQCDRVIVSYIRTRSPGAHGIYASVQPLRFEGGSPTTKRRGRVYEMPRIEHEGREILYIVYFALPRFANLSFEEKLTTVFHELYHIGPEFDGDIRRFPGKYYAHGKSRKSFNERIRGMMEAYAKSPGAEEQLAFLRKSFKELQSGHGCVTGNRVRPPKPRHVSVDKG